jgi:23S rRNA (uracil1939-C5)-methyltransferase
MHAWGQSEIAVHPDSGTVLRANTGSFTQVNSAANLALVETVGRLAEVLPGERVLDLYAGVGNLSSPLARKGARVLAVEQHPQAAKDNAANALRLGLTEYEVRQEPAERTVARLVETEERFDVVVLDPPRSGARLAIDSLLRLAAPRVIYVSCDPATLARDVRAVGDRYRIETVQPIDMFPHTYHVEVVLCATSR